jgi:hypothetical protein
MHLTYHDSDRHTSVVSGASASEAGAPEIEVTPAMIDAGLAELMQFSREGDIYEERVTAIYRAMVRSSREETRD